MQGFGRLLSLSPYFNANIGMRVGFGVLGLAAEAGTLISDDGCGYVYRSDSRWLTRLLDGSTRRKGSSDRPRVT